jgi:alkaline phosphatase
MNISKRCQWRSVDWLRSCCWARRPRSPPAVSRAGPTTSGPRCTRGHARKFIYFLGDGMGTQEITAARYYQYAAAGA